MAFAVGVLWPLESVNPAPDIERLALSNVTIVDIQNEQLIPGQTVLVEGGRIVAVGNTAGIQVPSVDLELDGTGRFLMPALWDMHAHVYAVSPLLDMPLYTAYGVTNVRDMQGCPKPQDPFIQV